MPYKDPEKRRASRREYRRRAHVREYDNNYQRQYRLKKFGPAKPKMTEEEKAESRRRAQRKWYDKNGREYHTNWKAANPDKVKAAQARVTKEAVLEKDRRWRAENPGKANAKTCRYRASKRKAIPQWMTDQELDGIEAVYTEAARLSSLTGVQFHVDHIIPLQGRTVCGLHVLNNLQILPYYENISKGNRLVHDTD